VKIQHEIEFEMNISSYGFGAIRGVNILSYMRIKVLCQNS